MKQDEALPGGGASIYYANNLFKFVSAGKLNAEEDGVDGANIRIELIKSRTNKAGQMVTMIFDQERGFDPVLSLLKFAEDNNLLEGRNPYKKFVGNPDVKFDSRKFKSEFKEREEVRKALYEVTKPYLYAMLSKVSDEDEKPSISDEEAFNRAIDTGDES